MKVYFWDGSEFKGTASPCCEVHVLGYRIKLLNIGKTKTTLFYKEKLLPEGYMTLLKNWAKKILKNEMAEIERESNLMYSWVKHHQKCVEIAIADRHVATEKVVKFKQYEKALKEISQSCPLLNADKDGMYGNGADILFARSTTRRMEIAKQALEK